MSHRSSLPGGRLSLLAAAAVLAAAPLFSPAPAAAQGPSPARFIGIPRGEFAGPGLLEVLRQRRDLSIFTKLLAQSGLADTIGSTDRYTVFAPDDRAWASVPAERLEWLQKKENRETLRQILRYHIVPSRMSSADIAATDDGLLIQTMNADNGLVIHSRLAPRYLAVNQASVLTPDIRVAGDIVHVVDAVTVPSGQYALALYGDSVRLESAASAALPAGGKAPETTAPKP